MNPSAEAGFAQCAMTRSDAEQRLADKGAWPAVRLARAMAAGLADEFDRRIA